MVGRLCFYAWRVLRDIANDSIRCRLIEHFFFRKSNAFFAFEWADETEYGRAEANVHAGREGFCSDKCGTKSVDPASTVSRQNTTNCYI